MGWLKRIFGTDKPKGASTKVASGRRTSSKAASKPVASAPASTAQADDKDDIPAYRVGLTGEYDESGLAKRVALAFDEDPQLDDVDTLWVAQLSGTVVLKGKLPSQDILQKMVSVAKQVDGTEAVDTSQVEVG
ncbi:MAG: phospholipid-binding protein [Leptolyngbya sp. SIO4C1]|nr:phospholipid-binding protein [Leptolyngbya sp. SIO4C1]